MKKILSLGLMIILGIFLIGSVSAANYCCEKTTGANPAWCQYEKSQANCDPAYQKTSAFCQATSYCRTGTCIDIEMGRCTTSSEVVCTNNGGQWSPKEKTELEQCKNGCCLIGGGASFTTQIACNKQAKDYGKTVVFNPNINTELSCLANANPEVMGACSYTENYVRNCKLITKKECQDKSKSSGIADVNFKEGYLCTAPELETICAKSESTRCGEDDRVYFVDTCDNLANVYDSVRVNDPDYWTKIQEPTCTTTNNPGNKNSATCGNCDYSLGSMCRQKKIGDSVNFGNYLCKDLDCKDYKGKYSNSPSGMAIATNYPKHGESWCATDEKNSGTWLSPGGSSFVLFCYNGEVNLPSECDETRQEVCKETIMNSATGFKIAGCKGNVWQDCVVQNNSDDCLNEEVRDCNWITGNSWNGYYYSTDGYLKNGEDSNAPKGICVPKYQSGFTAEKINNCGAASAVCKVKMEKGIFQKDKESNWKCKENCSCIEDSEGNDDRGATWANNMNSVCTLLGDCGVKKNYIGEFGYPTKQVIITEGESK